LQQEHALAALSNGSDYIEKIKALEMDLRAIREANRELKAKTTAD
jgi:chromosome segregation ATPase